MRGRRERPAAARCGRHAELPLRIGVSTRALFDLEAEHAVYEAQGVDAYVERQHRLESEPMAEGPGFDAIERLLGLNEDGRPNVVEVTLLSRNAPDMSVRVFAALAKRGLAITTGSFTNGRPVAPLLAAWGVDLFLSNDADDVEAAAAAGIAAAAFAPRSRQGREDDRGGEVRIAFDGDAVVFADESDAIFMRDGLEAFLRHETENATVPMAPGPFGGVFAKIGALGRTCLRADGSKAIRTALVTARRAPAHARVVHTLRAWGVEFDEAHFVGGRDKASVLAAFGAHVFFDDQERHVSAAAGLVAAAHVPNIGMRWRSTDSASPPSHSPGQVSKTAPAASTDRPRLDARPPSKRSNGGSESPG